MLGSPGQVDHQGRSAGIERRVDPAIDPEGGGGGSRLAPIECRHQPGAEFRAGHEGAGDDGEYAGGTDSKAVAPGHVGLGRRDPQAADGRFGAPAVQFPQGARAGIGGAERQAVVEGAGGPVPETGVAVDAVQGLGACRAAQAGDRPERETERSGEQGKAEGARERRRIQPDAEPGHRQEEKTDRKRDPEQWPRPLPPQGPARPIDEALEPPMQLLARNLRLRRCGIWNWAGAFSHAGQPPFARQAARNPLVETSTGPSPDQRSKGHRMRGGVKGS